MTDQRPAWRVDSGMLSRLTGSHRPLTNPSIERESLTEQPPPEIPDFLQTRELIFRACCEAYKSQHAVSLLVLTIDEFAAFERNYGRDTGVKAISFIERTLCHHRDLIFGSQSGVVIGRYVEDRYLILLPGVTGAVATEYSEYIRKALVSTEFAWNYRSLYFTVSIGIAHKPGHNGDQDMLILQADQACDQIIAAGGNRVAVAKITQPFRLFD